MADSNSDRSVPQLSLPQQGLTQAMRLPAGLKPEYVKIDERDANALFEFIQARAADIAFYHDSAETPQSDWSAFFPFATHQAQSWFEQQHGQVPPHLALFKVFVELYQQGPQARLNQLQQDYLRFYYQSVLNFKPLTARPAHAHVQISLHKNAAPVLISPHNQLSAGERADKSTILVVPVSPSLINHAQVVEKRSVFRSLDNPGQLNVAPIADSIDGLGEAFAAGQEKWSGFGHETLSAAEIGFAVSSDLLFLAEGTRVITLTLTLSDALFDAEVTHSGLLAAYLTTAEGWSDSVACETVVAATSMTITLTLAAAFAPVSAYVDSLHGYQLDTPSPVLQFRLKNDAPASLRQALFAAFLESAKLAVRVTGMTNLNITADTGGVDPSNAFLPFGPLPKVGAKLQINSDEVFTKRVQNICLNLHWKSPPSSFATHYYRYSNYTGFGVMPHQLTNQYFTVATKLIDGDGRELSGGQQPLFNLFNATYPAYIEIGENAQSSTKTPGTSTFVSTLGSYNSQWAQSQLNKLHMLSPLVPPRSLPGMGKLRIVPTINSNQKPGATLTLQQSFFHAEFQQAYVKNVIDLANQVAGVTSLINPPYTPELASISLDYDAYTQGGQLGTPSQPAFANSELAFFHLDCFGQRKEHAYQRQQLEFVKEKRVSLLPAFTHQGALYVGIANLGANQACQLLFQVVDGSADPALMPAKISWSVLCDNYWKTLSKQELVSDNTNGLLTSGVVKLIIPRQATTAHTLMPAGLIWLKLAVDRDVSSVCQLRRIVANVIEVQGLASTDADTQALDPLPAGSVSQFVKAVAGVKQVTQLYDGFGGAEPESDTQFNARVSERLRHKNRALSLYDIETLTLQQFPHLHRVKALAHTKPDLSQSGAECNYQSPGHVSCVLLPFVNSHNAIDPLRPRTDSQTLSQVRGFLSTRGGMQARFHTLNPTYLRIRLSFAVRFSFGLEFNYHRQQLEQALFGLLAPWLSDQQLSPEFGGRVYKSVVMDFIEQQPYVDFISDVLLQATLDGVHYGADGHVVSTTSPNQILTSAPSHNISEVPDD